MPAGPTTTRRRARDAERDVGRARELWDRAPERLAFLAAASGIAIKFGKLDETLEDGDSASMTVWSGDPLSATSETLDDVSDWFLPSGDEYATGTKVIVLKYSGKWYVINAACNV